MTTNPYMLSMSDGDSDTVVNTEPIPIEEIVTDAAEAMRNIDQMLHAANVTIQACASLSRLTQHVKKFNGVTREMINLTNENNQLGAALGVRIPSYESDMIPEDLNPEDVDGEVVLESISSKMKSLKDGVVAFFKRLWKYVTDFYEKHLAWVGRLTKRLETLKDRFKKTADFESFQKLKMPVYKAEDLKSAITAYKAGLAFTWNEADFTVDKLVATLGLGNAGDDTVKGKVEELLKSIDAGLKLGGFKYEIEMETVNETSVPKVKIEKHDGDEVLEKGESELLINRGYSTPNILTAMFGEVSALLKAVTESKKNADKLGRVIKNVEKLKISTENDAEQAKAIAKAKEQQDAIIAQSDAEQDAAGGKILNEKIKQAALSVMMSTVAAVNNGQTKLVNLSCGLIDHYCTICEKIKFK